VFYTKAKT